MTRELVVVSQETKLLLASWGLDDEKIVAIAKATSLVAVAAILSGTPLAGLAASAIPGIALDLCAAFKRAEPDVAETKARAAIVAHFANSTKQGRPLTKDELDRILQGVGAANVRDQIFERLRIAIVAAVGWKGSETASADQLRLAQWIQSRDVPTLMMLRVFLGELMGSEPIEHTAFDALPKQKKILDFPYKATWSQAKAVATAAYDWALYDPLLMPTQTPTPRHFLMDRVTEYYVALDAKQMSRSSDLRGNMPSVENAWPSKACHLLHAAFLQTEQVTKFEMELLRVES